MRYNRSFKILYSLFNNGWQHHAHLVKSIFLSCYKSIKLVKTYSTDQFMTHFFLIHSSFPLDILRTLCDCFNQETRTIIIIQKLILHFNKCFTSRSGIHRVMLILHFHIHSMNAASIRNFNTINIFIDNIPTAFLAIRRYMTVCYVLKNSLMKISNIIVV